MGTRNLTMVINKDGVLKVAQYGQWDGYPSGQGSNILDFARNKEYLKRLEAEFDNMKFFNDCKEIADYIKGYDDRCPEWSNEPDRRTEADIYWFDNLCTRDLGGNVLHSIINIDKSKLPKEMNNIIYLNDQHEFGKESLMCEWAYCINLKTNKLECYCGFNTRKELESPMFATSEATKYYGCRLLKEYDLDNLPTTEEFVAELEALEGNNE